MARETFTDQQWQQLVDAAPSIARGVAAASGSPAQTELELEAFLRLLEQTRNETSGHGLLGSLVADVHARLSSGTLSLAAEDVVADGIHAARQAGALLAVSPDEQEARAARYWLMEVARTVAGATRDGGLLGLGGRALSRAERDTLAAISEGLGMNESVNLRDEAGEATPAADTAPAADAEPEGKLGPDGQPIGPDNIREGTVRGVMGGPYQQGGEGQGG
ncbi:hypothetical protein BH24CHL6_BH24CHL6_06650 [soil metagenome]